MSESSLGSVAPSFGDTASSRTNGSFESWFSRIPSTLQSLLPTSTGRTNRAASNTSLGSVGTNLEGSTAPPSTRPDDSTNSVDSREIEQIPTEKKMEHLNRGASEYLENFTSTWKRWLPFQGGRLSNYDQAELKRCAMYYIPFTRKEQVLSMKTPLECYEQGRDDMSGQIDSWKKTVPDDGDDKTIAEEKTKKRDDLRKMYQEAEEAEKRNAHGTS